MFSIGNILERNFPQWRPYICRFPPLYMNQSPNRSLVLVTTNRRILLDPDNSLVPETTKKRKKKRKQSIEVEEGNPAGSAFINNWPGRNVFLARKVTYSE